MSIEYALKLVSSTPPGRIAELVRGSEKAALQPLPRGFAVGLPGVHCAVLAVDDIDAEIAEESHGIRPTIAVVFRIDKDRREDGLRTMRAALVRVLGVEPGDAILLANLEHPVLRRRDGHGVLIDQFGPWPEAILAALGPTWTVGPDLSPQSS
jgi:hypothetical protein